MISHYEHFVSDYVAPRSISIWLPDDLSDHERLPVLYMHDGQNLFDPLMAFGGVDWAVDEAVTTLRSTGKIRGAIVVGIWNTSLRWREYMPRLSIKGLNSAVSLLGYLAKAKGMPVSDDYLLFLVKELKPYIDKTYPVLDDQPNTFILGSSMGGLISAYAMCMYPHIYGGAGCLSTHWPAGRMPLVNELGRLLPSPGRNKFYFDFGTSTLDSNYEPYQSKMDTFLVSMGYTPGLDWVTRKFEGAEHNEAAWRKRIHIPLEFLLGL